MRSPKAFTFKSDRGLFHQLITPCSASLPFDPRTGGQHPDISRYSALWDTGASGTVISKAVVEQLGLKPTGREKIFHANGEAIVNCYYINLFLPNNAAIPFVHVAEGILNGFDLLIGMDIITYGDFSITNFNDKTTFSFRVPSIAEIDFVKEIQNSAGNDSDAKVT